MGLTRLQEALKQLREAIRAVEAVIDEMRAEHDALALHVFARRNYRQSKDTKSRKRRDRTVLLSFHKACALGFRDDLAEWSPLPLCSFGLHSSFTTAFALPGGAPFALVGLDLLLFPLGLFLGRLVTPIGMSLLAFLAGPVLAYLMFTLTPNVI